MFFDISFKNPAKDTGIFKISRYFCSTKANRAVLRIKKIKMQGLLCKKTQPSVNIRRKSAIFAPNEKH